MKEFKSEHGSKKIGRNALEARLDKLEKRQQQTMQMMSNISKMVHDTAMAIIRKIGG